SPRRPIRGSRLRAPQPPSGVRPWTPSSDRGFAPSQRMACVYNPAFAESNGLFQFGSNGLTRDEPPLESCQREIAYTACGEAPGDLQPRVRNCVVDAHAAGNRCHGRDVDAVDVSVGTARIEQGR